MIRLQINIELYASYVYLSMSFYFDRDDVALPNIAKFFKHQSDEEREHATELMRVQNLRGGRVVLQDIQKPEKDEWGTALKAFEAALALEKFNNESLLKLHTVAGGHNDAHLTDFIEEKYLDEQVTDYRFSEDFKFSFTGQVDQRVRSHRRQPQESRPRSRRVRFRQGALLRLNLKFPLPNSHFLLLLVHNNLRLLQFIFR